MRSWARSKVMQAHSQAMIHACMQQKGALAHGWAMSGASMRLGDESHNWAMSCACMRLGDELRMHATKRNAYSWAKSYACNKEECPHS